MVEKQSDIGKTPDRSLETTLTTADRLVFAYQARQDFAWAFEIANDIPEPGFAHDKVNAIIDIGIVLARSGLDYSEAIERLSQLANRVDESGKVVIQTGIVEIHREGGKFDEADEVLLKACMSSDSSLERVPDHKSYLTLARQKARFGQDPRAELEKAYQEIQQREANGTSSRIQYAELAQAHFELTGEYPEAYLSKAEGDIDEHAGRYPDAVHVPGWYGDIAKAYATCGNFEKGTQMLDKIKGYNPIHEAEVKIGVLGHMVKELIERGLYQDAVRNARAAIQVIGQAEAQPEYLTHHLRHFQREELVKMYALIGKAHGLSGEDPMSSFTLALEKTEEFPFKGVGVRSLIEIAKAQESVGINSSVALDLALRDLDEIPEGEDYDNSYHFAAQLKGYEDLICVQLELGKVDEARVTLSRLENLENRENSKDIPLSIVAFALATIAQASAKKGLSPIEIDALSQEEIRDVLGSSNELVAQAAVYFELDNRVL